MFNKFKPVENASHAFLWIQQFLHFNSEDNVLKF